MNWEELFQELFDQLFWDGFTFELRENEPERYRYELDEFIGMYS